MRRFNSSAVKVKNASGEFEGLPALRGQSAYEIAVQNGYKGSEAEWIESTLGDGWVTAFQELESKHNTLAASVATMAPKVLTGTLLASNWTEASGAYEYTLAVAGLPADPTSIKVDVDLSGVTEAEAMIAIDDAWGNILKCVVVSEGDLYFLFKESPSVNIPIKAEVIA